VWGKGTRNINSPIRVGTLRFRIFDIFLPVFLPVLFRALSIKVVIFHAKAT